MPEIHADNTDDIAGTDDDGETCTDWFGQATEACPLHPPPQPSHIILADPRPTAYLVDFALIVCDAVISPRSSPKQQSLIQHKITQRKITKIHEGPEQPETTVTQRTQFTQR